MTPPLYGAHLALPGDISERDILTIVQKFEPLGVSASIHRERDGGDWLVQCISENEIPVHEFAALCPGAWRVSAVPDTDWLAASYRQFPAFSIGPFFIYGSHYDEAVPAGKTGLQIDAATAFGSGEHGTTKGCLMAMLDLKDSGVCPWNVLDMGTGSGILGLAAWKLWKTPVLAVDNDSEAVRVACRHRGLNGVPADNTGMICAAGEGFSTKPVQEKKPFDLIIANILAGTLRGMASDIKNSCDKNGFVILSGILRTQAQEVVDAYQPLGFILKKRFDIGEWSTLVLQDAPAQNN